MGAPVSIFKRYMTEKGYMHSGAGLKTRSTILEQGFFRIQPFNYHIGGQNQDESDQ